MQFFKISVILCFSVGFLFFLFFSPAKFSQPPLDQLAPNLAGICLPALCRKGRGRLLKSSKTRSQRPKKQQNRWIFHTRRHIFARCDETVKDFWKTFFAMTPRVLCLSENVIEIVQNSPVFSNTLLNGTSKKTDFDGNYLDNDEN